MRVDTISDTLTRIRNANLAKHEIVYIPLTKMSLAITKILKSEGFIDSFKNYNKENQKYLLILLKYIGKSRKSAICKIKRVSKPGFRVYLNAEEVPNPNILGNIGIIILSTSKGVLSNREARKFGVGGEFLCNIW